MSPVLNTVAASSTATLPASFAGVSSRLPQVVRLVLNALANPTDDPKVAVLSFALIGTVLGLIVVLTWLVASFFGGPEEGPAAEPPTPEEAAARRRRRRIVGTVLLLAALSLPFVGWKYGTQNAACARCHATKSAVASNARDTHATAACSSCHIAPGARGAYVAAAQAVRNLGVQLRGSSSGAMPPAVVSNGACLTCHADVNDSVVLAKGIRKPRSRKAGHLELFTCSRLLLAKGRDLDVVTQAETVRAYRPLREDLLRGAYAAYAVELLDRFTPDEQENAEDEPPSGCAFPRSCPGAAR